MTSVAYQGFWRPLLKICYAYFRSDKYRILDLLKYRLSRSESSEGFRLMNIHHYVLKNVSRFDATTRWHKMTFYCFLEPHVLQHSQTTIYERSPEVMDSNPVKVQALF